MCLAVPQQIAAIAGESATVVHNGVSAQVSLLAADAGLTVGDWVLVHSGFVLQRLTDDDVLAIQQIAAQGDRHEGP